ncbi:MAG: hypothetical protein WD967_00190 [Candidatus Levyibacteriota bacterium]
MPSPEQLKPISVPLQEKEIFVDGDESAHLTRVGSLLQKYVIFNYGLTSPEMSPAKAAEYRVEMEKTAVQIGIERQEFPVIAQQWSDIRAERHERFYPPKIQLPEVAEQPVALPSHGVIFEREVVGVAAGS